MSNLKKQDGTTSAINNPHLRSVVDRARALSAQQTLSADLELCLCFDTTGSMHKVFKAGQQAIEEVVQGLNTPSTGTLLSFVAYKNHGDECLCDGERPFIATSWSNDSKEILKPLHKITSAGGGDGLTALEDVFDYLVRNVEWQPGAKKAIVVIGDMPPHGVVDSITHCPRQLDYRRSIASMKELGITVYSVFCPNHYHDSMGSDRCKKIISFYDWIAAETGGRRLSLEDMQTLVTILVGIGMTATGRLEEYRNLLVRRQALTPGKEQILNALSSENK